MLKYLQVLIILSEFKVLQFPTTEFLIYYLYVKYEMFMKLEFSLTVTVPQIITSHIHNSCCPFDIYVNEKADLIFYATFITFHGFFNGKVSTPTKRYKLC